MTRDSEQRGRGKFSRNEYCGLICCKDGEYKSTPPHSGPKARMKMVGGIWVRRNGSSCDPTFDYETESNVSCFRVFGEGWKEVGMYHSHTLSPDFSGDKPGGDRWLALNSGKPYYLGTELGDVKKTDGTKEGTETIPPPGVPDLSEIPINPEQGIWPQNPIQ